MVITLQTLEELANVKSLPVSFILRNGFLLQAFYIEDLCYRVRVIRAGMK
jgi:hypothetical protein